MSELALVNLLGGWINPAGVGCMIIGVIWLLKLQARVEATERMGHRHERGLEKLDDTQDKILQSLGRIEGKINGG